MTKGSFQKLSVLGIVLMGASALTAWIMPKNKPAFAATGRLQQISVDGNNVQQSTCKIASSNLNCDFSATGNGSFTTTQGATSADAATTGADNTGLITHGDGVAVSS